MSTSGTSDFRPIESGRPLPPIPKQVGRRDGLELFFEEYANTYQNAETLKGKVSQRNPPERL